MSDESILTKAEIIHQKFEQLFELFSKVDSLLSHDLPVAETTIPKIDKAISDYMEVLSQEFPWRKRATKATHFGTSLFCLGRDLGLWNVSDGEQGGEQLHATINALKRRAWGIRKERDQLKFLMKQHHTQISPTLRKHLSTTPTKKALALHHHCLPECCVSTTFLLQRARLELVIIF